MQTVEPAAVDANDRGLFRAGGLAALVLVAGYLATFPLYAAAGGPPSGDAEARLLHYGEHLSAWWGILGLMVFTDLLYLMVALALYRALQGINRGLMLLAVACKALFVVLDLAVTWTNHAVLFDLGSQYAAATSDEQRAGIVATARVASAVMGTPLPSIYAIAIPSTGTLLAGLVMWKGVFGRGAAYVAVLAGVTAYVAVAGPYLTPALDLAHVVNALLETLWYLLVGVGLYRLGRPS